MVCTINHHFWKSSRGEGIEFWPYYEENPLPYDNWTTPDGKNFFCEWYDDCPPCEDSIRGPRMPGGGSWQEQDADGFGLGHPDADDFVHY